MTRKLGPDEIFIDDIESSAAIIVDTRFIKISLSDEVRLINGTQEQIMKEEYFLAFDESEVLEIIKTICKSVKDYQQNTGILIMHNNSWMKYILFIRINSDEFIMMDRNFRPVFGISDLELTFSGKKFIPSENA